MDYEVPHVFLKRSRRSTYKISQTFNGDFFNRIGQKQTAGESNRMSALPKSGLQRRC